MPFVLRVSAPSLACLLLLALCGTGLGGCRTAPMVEPAPIFSPLGVEKNRVAIYRGMLTHRWEAVSEEPGRVVAKLGKSGAHYAEVEIVYDDRTITIRYHGSEGLGCQPAADSCGEIHRAYNRWVSQLAKDITYQTQLARIDTLPPVGTNGAE